MHTRLSHYQLKMGKSIAAGGGQGAAVTEETGLAPRPPARGARASPPIERPPAKGFLHGHGRGSGAGARPREGPFTAPRTVLGPRGGAGSSDRTDGCHALGRQEGRGDLAERARDQARAHRRPPGRDRRELRRRDREQDPGRHRHQLEPRRRAPVRLRRRGDDRPAHRRPGRARARGRDAGDPRPHPARRAGRPLRDGPPPQGRRLGRGRAHRLAGARPARPDRRRLEDRARHQRAPGGSRSGSGCCSASCGTGSRTCSPWCRRWPARPRPRAGPARPTATPSSAGWRPWCGRTSWRSRPTPPPTWASWSRARWRPTAAGPARLAVEAGPPVVLARGQVTPVCLILHELATNAVKHGALSSPAGQVRVGWRNDEEAAGGRRRPPSPAALGGAGRPGSPAAGGPGLRHPAGRVRRRARAARPGGTDLRARGFAGRDRVPARLGPVS